MIVQSLVLMMSLMFGKILIRKISFLLFDSVTMPYLISGPYHICCYHCRQSSSSYITHTRLISKSILFLPNWAKFRCLMWESSWASCLIKKLHHMHSPINHYSAWLMDVSGAVISDTQNTTTVFIFLHHQDF